MSTSYHHGNLRNKLIEGGIATVNEEGINNFSLRKVAKRLGVSPTACYNHFLDKEALLESMKEYVNESLENILLNAAKLSDKKYSTLEMGKAYVKFFAEHPNYFNFIYDNEDYYIELMEDDFVGDHKAFCIFRDAAIEEMKALGIPKGAYRDNLVAMWGIVHGLAAMSNMKGFYYDGDWGILAERILEQKIKFD